MNKCNIELTKEELMILINGLDYQQDMGSAVFSEYDIDAESFSKRLNDIFYKLKWSEN